MSDPTSLERQPRNRPLDLDRISPDPSAPDFFEMQVAHRPVPVRIEYAAIRELHRQLEGEGESVGLLLGSSTPDALCIQRCEVLAVAPGATGDPKSLLGAFRESLKARSQNPVEGAPQLLGCFRTQVAGWPGLKDGDFEIIKRTSPGIESLFVLIRTTRHRPWLAALYALDAKNAPASGQPALEFPFDEYLLRNGYLTDLVETSESSCVPEPPRKSKTPWIVAASLFAILVAGSAAAYKFKLFRTPGQAEVAGRNPAKPVALNLKVNRSGKDFEVSWDRLSAAVQEASGGMLMITDGALTRPVALNGSQLREGRILYTPLFEELSFRLEVVTPDLGTVAESVQVLAWSGKQPVDVSTVAPPDPLANTPARAVAVPASPVAASPKAPIPAAKSVPGPVAAVNNLKKPPAAKQTQPAKPTSPPESVAVIQPPAPTPAPAPPARKPESVLPAPSSEKIPAAQPSSQVPATPPPSPPPAVPAPKPEAQAAKPSVNQNAAPAPALPSPKPAVIPAIVSNTAPAPVPSTPRVSGNIMPPVPIRRQAATPPNLPSGTTPRVISVRVMVDSAGSVQSADVIAANPKGAFGEERFKRAALDAAKMWKFRPGQVDGKNVAAEYSIDFKF